MRTWLLNGGFEDEKVDPEYVPELHDSDECLEYRFEAEALQEYQDDDPEVIAESEDCPATPNCEKTEHRIVKDLAMVESSEEAEESNELDLEIKEFQEGGSVCNILACENPKQQVSEEVEVTELEVLTVRGIIDNKSIVDAVHTIAAVSDKKPRVDIGIIKLMRYEGGVAPLHIGPIWRECTGLV